MKKYTTFILTLLMLLAFATTANASLSLIDKDRPVDEIPNSGYGMIAPGYHETTGLFDYLEYWVTATGATSGTRYRTTRLWMEISGYTLWFDTPALAEWSPPPGRTLAAAVKIDMDDIFREMVNTMPHIATEEEAEEYFYWAEQDLAIGPEIEIYDVATGQAISEGGYTPAEVETLLRNNGFSNTHISDVLDRFQGFPLRSYFISVSHNLVAESSDDECIEYNGKKYEFVEQIDFEFFKVDEGTTKTFQRIEEPGIEYLVGSYEGSGRASFDEVFTEDTEITVTADNEHNVISANFYYTATELPDFEVVSLNPGAEATESGGDYTGTVVYRLKDTISEPVEAKLHMTHNGFGLQTPDGEEINNKTITFQPGESKTFQFAWTGQGSNSTFRAEIWPTGGDDANPGDNVKEVIVRRDVKTNLSVRIIESPAKSRGGQPVHVVALVESNSDELIHTNIEWKINGTRHHYSDDLIFRGNREAKITFNMPSQNASVEVVVNQNNDRPVEDDVSDNRATAVVQFEPDPVPQRNDFWISIDAPEVIPTSLPKDRRPFNYTVNFNWDWTQTCTWVDGGCCDYDPETGECTDWDPGYWSIDTPPTRTFTLEVVTQGYFSRAYNNVTKKAEELYFNDDRYSETFTMQAKGGACGTTNTATKSFTFSYPHEYPRTNYGVFGQDTYTIIKASANVGAEAEKKVITKTFIIPQYDVHLIQ